MKAEREQQLEASSKDGKDGSHAKLTVQRPKRNIMQKNLEYNNGLLWREEKELKKALYASLQETKKNRLCEENNTGVHLNSKANPKKRKKDGLVNGDRTEDSPNATPKRTKVHAQRKFAQGSNPNSPAPTPIKIRNNTSTAVDLLPSRRPKTEDFLTFLCLRGTAVLPPSLDFFGLASRSDASSESRCPSPTNSDVIEKPRAAGKQLARSPNKNGKINRSIRLANLRRLKEMSPDSDDSDMDDSEIEYDMLYKHERNKNDCVKKTSNHNGKLAHSNNSSPHAKTKVIASSVLALKNKYKQQRLAKQKKELVKKILDSKITKADATSNGKVPPSQGKSKANSISKVAKKKAKVPKLPKASAAKSKPSNVQANKGGQGKKGYVRKLATTSPTKNDATLPSTARNSTMITRSVKEELDRAAFEASKRASDRERRDVKKCAAKKSAKPITRTQKPLRSLRSAGRCTGAGMSSDFSTDDDEPLVKKTKGNAKKASPLKKNSEVMKRLRKEKMMRLSGGKFLRSCVVDLGKRESNMAVVMKTNVGRPTRKTKEAATAYLELLGKKLSLPDPFDDVRKKKKTSPKSVKDSPKMTRSQDRVEPRQTRAKSDENQKPKVSEKPLVAPKNKKMPQVAKKAAKPIDVKKKKTTPVVKNVNAVKKVKRLPETAKEKKQNATAKRPGRTSSRIKNIPLDSSSESSSESETTTTSTTTSSSSSDSEDSVDFEQRLKLSNKLNNLKTPPKGRDAKKSDDNVSYDGSGSAKPSSKKKPLKSTNEISPSLNLYSTLGSSLRESTLGDFSSFDDDVVVHVGEPTSIAVKENVSSNSVAIQVNLVDDISEFDEDIMEFAGSDFGSENSLTLDKILTPSCFLDSRLEASPKNRLETYFNSVSMPLELPQKSKTKEETPVKSSTSSSPSGSPSKAKPVSKDSKDEQDGSPDSTTVLSGKRRGRPPNRKPAPKPSSERNSKRKTNEPFPSDSSKAKLVEAPTFHPTADEFNDPLEYIEKIRPEAERYGICRIIPPASFKPECKVNEEMRFTAHNQYIHKTMQRC